MTGLARRERDRDIPRPLPGPDGRTPTKGRQTCRVCGRPIVRKGRFMASDGVRGQWRHEEKT
jgi:hypothetical protein